MIIRIHFEGGTFQIFGKALESLLEIDVPNLRI
jgi:hypothetical protein